MESINNFCKNIALDYRILESRNENNDVRDVRAASFALRFFGGLLLTATAITFVATLPASIFVPGALIALTISTLFFIVLAHDLIKSGNNLRDVVALGDPYDPSQTLIRNGQDIVNKAFRFGNCVYKQSKTDIPFVVEDTVIFERIYNLFNPPEHIRERKHRHY